MSVSLSSWLEHNTKCRVNQIKPQQQKVVTEWNWGGFYFHPCREKEITRKNTQTSGLYLVPFGVGSEIVTHTHHTAGGPDSLYSLWPWARQPASRAARPPCSLWPYASGHSPDLWPPSGGCPWPLGHASWHAACSTTETSCGGTGDDTCQRANQREDENGAAPSSDRGNSAPDANGRKGNWTHWISRRIISWRTEWLRRFKTVITMLLLWTWNMN